MRTPEEELRELGKLLPVALGDKLRRVHEGLGFGCCAKDEGQTCCMDLMLGPSDVKVYAQAAAAAGGAGIEGV